MEPCGTTTEAGTDAAVELELDSWTVTPPDPAAKVSVTVPVTDCPVVAELGDTDKLLSTGLGAAPMVTLAVLLAPPYEAVSTTVVAVLTVPAVTLNVADVEPCGTSTDDGTEAAVEFEDPSWTVTPPDPAGAVNDTVPVPDCPLGIEFGFTDRPLSAAGAGSMVTPVVSLTPPYEAVMVAEVAEPTLPPVTETDAEVEPCGIVRVAGTGRALGLELVSETATPPVPAGAAILTARLAACPLLIVLGLTVTPSRASGFIVRPKVSSTPRYAAVRVTEVGALTVPAPTVKLTKVEPAGMVTVDGRVASAGLAVSDIVAPEPSAGAFKLTVQAAVVGGVTDVMLQVKPLRLGPTIVIIPFDPAAVNDPAFGSAATVFESPTVAEASVVLAARV